MKYILTLFLLSANCFSHGQTIPTEIKSVKTSAHVNIPGSRVFIIPPQGFTPSDELPAIQDGDNGMIEALDLVEGNFYTNAATFNRKSFEDKGIKVLDYSELKVDGYPGKMILAQTPDGAKVYNLVFGDTTFSVSLMAVYPQSNDKMGTELQKALQTICYDKSFKIDPFALAVFTLDDSLTHLKFVKYTASVYLYTLNGKTNRQMELSDDNPIFMVIPLPAESTMPEIIADIMLSKLREKGTTVLSMENAVTGKTNGFPSFQREVYAMIQDKKTLLYQHVVIINKTAIIMQGEATANFPAYLKDFQALSSTIRKK